MIFAAGCGEPAPDAGAELGESSGAARSTGEQDSSGPDDDMPTTSGVGTDGTTGGDTTGATDAGVPEVECVEDECTARCAVTNEFQDSGATCSCDDSPQPDSIPSCPAASSANCGDSWLCKAQAIRYGISGAYSFQYSYVDDGGGGYRYQVFGDGRGQGASSSWDYCCGYSNSSSSTLHYRVQQVRAADDPWWDSCLEELDHGSPYSEDEPPFCLAPSEILTGEACETTGDECPAYVPHVSDKADCETSCPMANDGICDEGEGTGLCAKGCDPIDCMEDRTEE